MKKNNIQSSFTHNEYRILVIDDNPEIHKDFMKILNATPMELEADFFDIEKKLFNKNQPDTNTFTLPGFTLDGASQGQEGLSMIQQAIKAGKPYALAFVDIRMPPGWDGIETIKHILEVDKDLQIVICTAYSDFSWKDTVSILQNVHNLSVLKKPFDNVVVSQLVYTMIKKWDLANALLKDEKELEVTHEKEKFINAMLDSLPEALLIVDNESNVVAFNQKLLELFKLDKMDTESLRKVSECFAEPGLALTDYLKSPEKINKTLKLKNNKTIQCNSSPLQTNDRAVGRVWLFSSI